MGRGGAGVGQFPALWMQVVVGGGALKWCERMMLCRNVCVMCVVACSLGWFLSTEGMQWIAGTYQDDQSIVPSHAAAGASAAAGCAHARDPARSSVRAQPYTASLPAPPPSLVAAEGHTMARRLEDADAASPKAGPTARPQMRCANACAAQASGNDGALPHILERGGTLPTSQHRNGDGDGDDDVWARGGAGIQG